MRVAILGCGAMGTVLGAFLTKNGCPVEFIDSYEAHVNALRQHGAQIIGTENFAVPVCAITPEQMCGTYDIVLLFTKSTANGDILPKLVPHLHEKSVVCTLQNGVPEPFVAKYVGEGRTVGGAVLWSATFCGPGVSELTQDLKSLDHYFDIGEMDGTYTQRIQLIADLLGLMGPATITTSLMASRWGKLVNNACMSGMSAVCGATFGQVLDHPKAAACLSYLGREVKQCCEAEGYVMPPLVFDFSPDSLALESQGQYEENQRMFYDMYQVALPAKASMLQDLEKGNATEVHMINGYVSEVGRARGIPTPFNDTVVDIVEKIEKGELRPSMENLTFFADHLFVYNIERGE